MREKASHLATLG